MSVSGICYISSKLSDISGYPGKLHKVVSDGIHGRGCEEALQRQENAGRRLS